MSVIMFDIIHNKMKKELTEAMVTVRGSGGLSPCSDLSTLQ